MQNNKADTTHQCSFVSDHPEWQRCVPALCLWVVMLQRGYGREQTWATAGGCAALLTVRNWALAFTCLLIDYVMLRGRTSWSKVLPSILVAPYLPTEERREHLTLQIVYVMFNSFKSFLVHQSLTLSPLGPCTPGMPFWPWNNKHK